MLRINRTVIGFGVGSQKETTEASRATLSADILVDIVSSVAVVIFSAGIAFVQVDFHNALRAPIDDSAVHLSLITCIV